MGYRELWVVDVESGVETMLTNLNALAQGVEQYAVSPDGETIAFALVKAKKGSGFPFAYDFDLVTMPAGGGPLNTLTYLGTDNPVYGIDWAPDGKDIMFSWNADQQKVPLGDPGIYRIHPTAGSGPELVFQDPSPESLPPHRAMYYAGGTRIAWDGQEYGQTTIEIWSVDANGNDVQQLTDDLGSARLYAIWEP